MKPYKENLISPELPFPVEIFIQDNEKSNIIVKPHWHDCIEILYMIQGTALQQINDRVLKVNVNDIILLNNGDIHGTWCAAEDKTKILVVKFLPEMISNISNIYESKYIITFLQSSNKYKDDSTRVFQSTDELIDLFMGAYNEFINKKIGYEIFIKGYIYQMIAILIRNDNIRLFQPTIKENELIEINPLLKYIELHYKENITLEEAASMVNKSYYHFSRFFKKATGRNYKEYIDFVRVCEAEKLLLSKDMNISQIAYEVGYNNVSSFNRVYKRIRGYSPSKIKKAKTAKN
ncbi:AraC family transcriptional regulator [Vallitalea maricola]|uniref:AraC family transcriptional regulator n=1 Tax=Vallitalea maricola TaxID=3074433 RepID=A0ACB5UG49_9FIRM|nr:AraC family transcriptional regulator [Vallitalea sp. AN17-2]